MAEKPLLFQTTFTVVGVLLNPTPPATPAAMVKWTVFIDGVLVKEGVQEILLKDTFCIHTLTLPSSTVTTKEELVDALASMHLRNPSGGTVH